MTGAFTPEEWVAYWIGVAPGVPFTWADIKPLAARIGEPELQRQVNSLVRQKRLEWDGEVYTPNRAPKRGGVTLGTYQDDQA